MSLQCCDGDFGAKLTVGESAGESILVPNTARLVLLVISCPVFGGHPVGGGRQYRTCMAACNEAVAHWIAGELDSRGAG